MRENKREKKTNMNRKSPLFYYICKAPDIGWVAEIREFSRLYIGKIFFKLWMLSHCVAMNKLIMKIIIRMWTVCSKTKKKKEKKK